MTKFKRNYDPKVRFYYVSANCSNCHYTGRTEFQLAIEVAKHRCPMCKCKTLVKDIGPHIGFNAHMEAKGMK